MWCRLLHEAIQYMKGVGGGRGRDRLDTSSVDDGSRRDGRWEWSCGSTGRTLTFTYAEDLGVYGEVRGEMLPGVWGGAHAGSQVRAIAFGLCGRMDILWLWGWLSKAKC